MHTDWTPADRASIAHVIDRIPSAPFLLVSAHGEARTGVIVRCVQQCAMNPPLVMVALEKGQPLSPIIRDSRNFTLCILDRGDKLTPRMFERAPDHTADPFLTIPHILTPSRTPVPARCLGWIDCEMTRHMDIDGDYEVYIGLVHHVGEMRHAEAAKPARSAPVPHVAKARPTIGSRGSRERAIRDRRSAVRNRQR
jgi:flavin reductase (DIM6/NTAB) family NADH-FMN oxidoreductase RutF